MERTVHAITFRRIQQEEYSAELVNRGLPASSVLMMTVAPHAAPTLAIMGKSGDSFTTWIDQAEAESGSADVSGREEVPYRRIGAHERRRIARAKDKPALERARGAIKELYP